MTVYCQRVSRENRERAAREESVRDEQAVTRPLCVPGSAERAEARMEGMKLETGCRCICVHQGGL